MISTTQVDKAVEQLQLTLGSEFDDSSVRDMAYAVLDMTERTTNFEDVKEWHEIFAQWQISREPARVLPISMLTLRDDLMQEELDELHGAMWRADLVEVADGIGDLLFTVYGTALAFGIDADKVFKEVMRSNMSKLGEDGTPILAENGKVMKGPNYSPPDLQFVLGDKP